MLNSTDKKKIDKILEEKLTEYKTELKAKNKDKVENTAKLIRENPPKDLITCIQKLKEKRKELEELEKETRNKFEGWNINRHYSDEYTPELDSRTEYLRTDRYNSESFQVYTHPEIKKIQEGIREKELAITDAGKAATLELYIGGRPPIEIINELAEKAKKIINS